MSYNLPSFDAVQHRQRELFNELMNNQGLAQGQPLERPARSESLRRITMRTARSILLKVLPAGVASFIAPPGVPCSDSD